MTREIFYEMLVESLTYEEFVRNFDCKPIDIQALDYNFYTDVVWNENLEFAYEMFND